MQSQCFRIVLFGQLQITLHQINIGAIVVMDPMIRHQLDRVVAMIKRLFVFSQEIIGNAEIVMGVLKIGAP